MRTGGSEFPVERPTNIATVGLLCATGLLGCVAPFDGVDLRAAGAGIEPVGPVALLGETPRRTPSEPPETAVHMAADSTESVAAVPDSKIRLDIGMKLEESGLTLSNVDYRVDDQRVSLEGSVPTLRDRDRAELVARSVRGVREVDNELTVATDPDP